MEKLLNNVALKIEQAYKEMDKLPLSMFEDDYEKEKILNEIYNSLIDCEQKIKRLK